MERKRILTGDRPTGKLHLGHYVGSIKNRVRLQDEYECFFIVADLHMLTTKPEKDNIEAIADNARAIVLDYLACGIDPAKSVIYLQSAVPEVVELSKRQAKESGGELRVTHSMDEAFAGADIVYPKSWAPYDVMRRRVPLLHAGDQAGLKELERECLANNAKFKDWECDERRMKLAKGSDDPARRALYMHCLPADITGVSCEAGEVAASVFDRYRDDTYREAGYKPYIIAAMILLGKSADPASTLEGLLRRSDPRCLI